MEGSGVIRSCIYCTGGRSCTCEIYPGKSALGKIWHATPASVVRLQLLTDNTPVSL